MYVVFDCETTGLPKDPRAPMANVDNWPRVIQLAWAVFNKDETLRHSCCTLIQPQGWEVPNERFWIENGFTTERCAADGIPIRRALSAFLVDIHDHAEVLVSHNMAFDLNVVGAECIRAGVKSAKKTSKVCTKEIGTNLCAIPGRYGYKWPKLSELHQHLFKTDFEGAHDALNDVMAAAKCFFELKRRGLA